MLYLSRKLGESIVINGNIEVKVIEVKGKAVKLGFDFPPDAQVLRKEIHDRVVEENRAAVSGQDSFGADDLADALSQLGSDSPPNKD